MTAWPFLCGCTGQRQQQRVRLQSVARGFQTQGVLLALLDDLCTGVVGWDG
ncbi:hypothetical protein [Streptomyces sp.]|uniref:hypothetical protein n=1 Tax=Streptomyces sp. TaxID=1931 RepID=UPI00281120F6|nr:hypothetical protein [Streptomyces sp.]